MLMLVVYRKQWPYLVNVIVIFFCAGVIEVYRVTKRVELGIKSTAVCSEKLQHLVREIDKLWNNLIGFMSLASLMVRVSFKYYFSLVKYFLGKTCNVKFHDQTVRRFNDSEVIRIINKSEKLAIHFFFLVFFHFESLHLNLYLSCYKVTN